MSWEPQFTARYIKRYHSLQSLRDRIDQSEARILADPYTHTEQHTHKHGFNLKACRSAQVGQNLRIIFVICEECRKELDREYCYCEGLPDQTVVFLTVGLHEKAYRMK